MTEEAKINYDESLIETVAGCMMDAYNMILSGEGLEAFLTKYVIMKETGAVGNIAYGEVILALNSFHALTILDIEKKAGQSEEQSKAHRKAIVRAFSRTLEGPA